MYPPQTRSMTKDEASPHTHLRTHICTIARSYGTDEFIRCIIVPHPPPLKSITKGEASPHTYPLTNTPAWYDLIAPPLSRNSMTSDKARTALGAGASLALRPTPVAGSYFSSHSDLGASADSGSNDAHGRTRSYNYEEGVDGALEAAGSAVVTDDGNGGGNGNGSGTASGNGHNAGVGGGGGGVGYGLFRIGFGPFGRGSARPGEGGKGTINKSSIGSDAAGSSSSSSAGGGGGAGGEAGGALGGINEDMPPPPPRPPLADAAKKAAGDVGAPAPAAAAVTRFPDPFQQLPTRLSGLPEHEEVVPKSPRASLDAATQVSILRILLQLFVYDTLEVAQ